MKGNKIIPHLWFEKEAKEAAGFYTGVFPDSRITSTMTLRDTPSGDTDVVTFDLTGHRFMAISAGPLFKFNPSISFMLNFDPSRDENATQNLNAMWQRLSDGGTILMPLDKYPFSERYGWVADKYGVSWQFILSDPAGEERPFIVPFLMFVGANTGRAEKAIQFYTSVFRNARQGIVARYARDQEPDKEGTIMFADFSLETQWFAAMDSAQEHDFGFNEAISLVVDCASQEEINYYWDKLSADRGAEQCGWLKDKFGVSWQVTPAELETMMSEGTPKQVARVTASFLKMKKLDLAELRRVYEEEAGSGG
jgi:predicted 3-demethylubiquinone-9 3-methyltransferase (glyoxalase superfamily)